MVGISNNRRTVYTKKVIREAFLDLLQEKELSKITVKEISESADVNRGTFYNYYKDPYDLFQQIENELTEEIIQNIAIESDELAPWLEKLLLVLKTNEHTMMAMLKSGNEETLLTNVLNKVKPISISQFGQHFPKATEAELELYFTYFSTGAIGVIKKWLLDYATVDPSVIVTVLTNVLSIHPS